MSKFALIGFPLGHSISGVIHKAGFESLGVNADYEILETPPDDLVSRLKYLKTQDYSGFNVTIPLKLPISLFVNSVDRYADLARAVNTVKIEADKTMSAYNTDVIGFRKSIEDVSLYNKKAGILGTGGAAHAAAVAMSEMNVKEIVFFTRNIPNSIDTMNYMRRKLPDITFNVYQIERISSLEDYAILVNATPVGMLGKAADMKPVYYNTLSTMNKDAVVFDLIYNPRKTLLLQDAQSLGLKTVNGLDMLIYQAAAAQEIWLGKKPDVKAMKIAALEAI
ncbi:MAG: shikimate dehydrogenase [Heliobacteriaceae bacterium]|jgi:shikimate dehydrogenase|nr:shikimate dehydrogenase [Heliobacteriaceae bacterium]